MEQQNTICIASDTPPAPDNRFISDMDTSTAELVVIPEIADNGENKENIPPTFSVMTRKKKGLTLTIPSEERLMEIAFDAKTVPATPTVEMKNPFDFTSTQSSYGTPHNEVNIDEIKQDLVKAPKRPTKTNVKRHLAFIEDSSKKFCYSSPPSPSLSPLTPPPLQMLSSPPQGMSNEECFEFYTEMIDNNKVHMKDRLMAITFTTIQEALKNNTNEFMSQLSKVRDNASFVKTVYNLSKIYNDFWIQMKSLTLGSTNGIRMATTSDYHTREQLCPSQFAFTRLKDNKFVPSLYQRLGQFGEDWVASQLDKDEMIWTKPGKICDLTFPIMSATPDYILLSKENKVSGVEGLPIDFGRSVIGFEECKSSYIWPLRSTPKVSDDLYTVEDILFDRGCKPTSLTKNLLKHDSKRLGKPNWPKLTNQLYDTIMASMKKTIKWRSVYTDGDSERCVRLFNPEVKGNKVAFRLFSSNIGKQLLMESMMILDYVQDDHILVRLDLPSVVNENELSQIEQYEDRAERRRYNLVLPDTADAELDRDNFMYNPEIAQALDLDTPSDDEEVIEDRFEVKYSMVAEFYLPVPSLKELRDVVIRPAIIESIADVAEKNFLVQKLAVNVSSI